MYTKKILNFPETKVIGLDRDSESIKKAKEIENKFVGRFLFVYMNIQDQKLLLLYFHF